MFRSPEGRGRWAALGLAIVLAACGPDADSPQAVGTVFENARVIVGDGTVLEQASLVVRGGVIESVGPSEVSSVGVDDERVDLSGLTIMPAIVNAHVHLPSTRPERAGALQHYAFWGQSAVISLGLDEGEVGLEMRDEVVPSGARSLTAGRGITSPEPGRTEVPYWVTDEDEARAAVRDLAGQRVDWVKIWVDDRNGQYERLSGPLYSAIIDEAHQHGLRVIAHVFTLEDAKGLLRAGIDAFAHGIRDRDIDADLLALWTARPDVVLIPNLPGPGVPTDVSWLAVSVPADQLTALQASASRESQPAQDAFGIQARNLVRLHEAGIRVAFGTDGGNPWAAHEELEDMVRTGMSPGDVIVAATSASAALLRLEDLGALTPGKRGDFIVLEGDPLDDIANTRQIADVYLGGVRLDRDALATKFLREPPR